MFDRCPTHSVGPSEYAAGFVGRAWPGDIKPGLADEARRGDELGFFSKAGPGIRPGVRQAREDFVDSHPLRRERRS